MTEWPFHPGQHVSWRRARPDEPGANHVYGSTAPSSIRAGRKCLSLPEYGGTTTVVSFVHLDDYRASILLMYPSEELWWFIIDEIPLANGWTIWVHRNHYESLNPLCLVALD